MAVRFFLLDFCTFILVASASFSESERKAAKRFCESMAWHSRATAFEMPVFSSPLRLLLAARRRIMQTNCVQRVARLKSMALSIVTDQTCLKIVKPCLFRLLFCNASEVVEPVRVNVHQRCTKTMQQAAHPLKKTFQNFGIGTST